MPFTTNRIEASINNPAIKELVEKLDQEMTERYQGEQRGEYQTEENRVLFDFTLTPHSWNIIDLFEEQVLAALTQIYVTLGSGWKEISLISFEPIEKKPARLVIILTK